MLINAIWFKKTIRSTYVFHAPKRKKIVCSTMAKVALMLNSRERKKDENKY